MTGSIRMTLVRIGQGIGLVGTDTMALFEPSNGLLAEDLWNLIDAGGGIDDILEAVSTTGLRALGSFAMVQFEAGGVRIVVRGSAIVEVGAGDDAIEVGAQVVRTWVEVFHVGSEVMLRLGDAAVHALPFRVDRGLVPADVLIRGRRIVPVLADLDFTPFAEFEPPVVQSSTPSVSLAIPTPEPELDPVNDNFPDAYTIFGSDLPRGLPAEPTVEPDQVSEYDYDALYGHTIARSVQSAAVAYPEEAAVPEAARQSVAPQLAAVDQPVLGVPSLIDSIPVSHPTSPPVALGDHDGHTVSKAQLAALRGATVSPAPAPSSGPLVQAMFCSSGHPNPTHLATCLRCGGQVSGAVVLVARPQLGQLRLSTGQVVALDRPLLIGRRPKLEGRVPNEMPTLLQLDVGQGLSRTHAAIRLEGWQVLVEDLGSANGTVVRLPGRAPHRLHEGEPALLEVGAFVDFGGEVSATLEIAR